MSTASVQRNKKGVVVKASLDGVEIPIWENRRRKAVARILASQYWHGAQNLKIYKADRETYIAESMETWEKAADELIALVLHPKKHIEVSPEPGIKEG